MDDHGQRENGRHKPDQYKSMHAQWMMPQHQMKDSYTMKLIAIMAERDGALQELNKALGEKREAFAERDKAYLRRDAAIAERDSAIMERNKALAALEAIQYGRENGLNGNGGPVGGGCPSNKHAQHHNQHHLQSSGTLLYDHAARNMHITEPFPIPSPLQVPTRKGSHHVKIATKEHKAHESGSLNKPKTPRKRSRKGEAGGSSSSSNRGEDNLKTKNHEGKGQDLGLNYVAFDDSTMAVPVCTCTGELHQCYKWGNGGWQSACCTTTLSMYPLPVMPNKRHSRVGGRKMSGSAFSKLLSRLAVEGHDLAAPLDLKDHWAKHGTNRYITIK